MLINIQNYHVLEGTTHGYYGNGELPEDYDYTQEETNALFQEPDDSELWRMGVFS